MQTPYGHLTYCTNIHAGETWADHFDQLQRHIPNIKKKLSPDKPFGIGLRLANAASLELRKEQNLGAFRLWLQDQNAYVFTMNGFPYGGFHHEQVKDRVHQPDWTTAGRVSYTIRLAQILAALLPPDMEGGISTSPLSYRLWHDPEQWDKIFETATLNLLQVVENLVQIKKTTGKSIHIDIEPEPDGLLESGPEFIAWYTDWLLPLGSAYLQEKFGYDPEQAEETLKAHVQLCYDVCHFAVGYEDHGSVIRQLQTLGIKTGKIQISAALKADIPEDMVKRQRVMDAFKAFDEPVYLHQVVAKQKGGRLKRYADMPLALADAQQPSVAEWRAHYHVPIFLRDYGVLTSTQEDIVKTLDIQRQLPFTTHLEIETYTWEVLPDEIKAPLDASITREMQWVIGLLNH
ncbi:MAG: metabolite traffic protein EboE [Chitinophagaceae bacterium]|nr:metabolite traffic protein EboE [Chitinophagaceae bacterium]